MQRSASGKKTDSFRKNRPPALQAGAVRLSRRSPSPENPSERPGYHSSHSYSSPEPSTPHTGSGTMTPVSAQAAAFTSNLNLDSNAELLRFKSTRPPPPEDDETVEETEVVPLASLEQVASLQADDADTINIGYIHRWQRGNLIGSGSFGKVYLGMNLDSGELFVVKQVMFTQKGDQEEVMQLEQEIALLGTLHHDNIVKYLGTERNNITNELSIFLEHMPGGSVAELVQRFGSLDESVIRKYTREALAGLIYLHERGIIHRDIKGQNILVDNRGVCKLADFGASRYLKDRDSAANLSFKGTPVFMPPEVIMEQRYSKKSDVWSIGCTFLQMATGNPPYSEFSNHIAALFHITSSTDPPPMPDDLSDNARAFVLECFKRDPKARPDAAQLRQHVFLTRKAHPANNNGHPLNATPSSRSDTTPTSAPSDTPKEATAEESSEEVYKRFKEQKMKKHKVTAYIRRGPSRGPSLKSGLTANSNPTPDASEEQSCGGDNDSIQSGIGGLLGKS